MAVTPRIECKQFVIEKVSSLKPHPSNSNKHSQKQIEVLAKIIAKNGQRSPIVVSNLSGFISKGHCRLEAIKLLGWEVCAVEYQDYVDELEELRDRVADNEIARYSEFEREKYEDELTQLDIDKSELDYEEFGLIEVEVNVPKIEKIDYSDKNTEINTDNFGNDLEHTCPKCGFEFND